MPRMVQRGSHGGRSLSQQIRFHPEWSAWRVRGDGTVPAPRGWDGAHHTHSAQPPSGGIVGRCLGRLQRAGWEDTVLPELGKQGERRQGGSLGGVSSVESWDDGGDDTELRGRESGAAALRIEGSWAGERRPHRQNQTERHKDMEGQERERQTDRHTHTHAHELGFGGQGEKK